MDVKKVPSPSPISVNQIGQPQPGTSNIKMTATPSTTKTENYTEYKVRVPRNLAKKYNMMRFHSGNKPDFSTVSKVSMSRIHSMLQTKDEEAMPTHGAGSEYGRERREEARKRRYARKKSDPASAPWALKIGGKGGKRYTGKKEAGINDNSNYYILTQCPDGAFEAVPVDSWYNFTPNINYQTLTADEAEEEFNRRDKAVNFFSLMVKKRLQNKNEGEGSNDVKDMKLSKLSSLSSNMRIHDDDLSMSDDDDDDDDDDNDDGGKVKTEKDTEKSVKQKGKGKGPAKTKRGSDDESDASSEEDGYFDSKEVDYMSDTSSSSEEELKVETQKPAAKDDLNVASSESESEEDAELTNAGRDIKKMLEKDQGEGGSSEEEDEDPDADDVRGPSALFLQDKRKGKKKSGSRSSTESSSRSSTPTAGLEGGTSSTITAAARKLGEGRPGTPTGKGKKRPASEPFTKKGFHAISESPAAKKLRVSPGPSSGTSTPTSSDDGQAISEESIRRYLARKPMTTKDLLQKFKTKRTGLTNEQTVKLIATILRKIQPEQRTIKGKMYLSLKST